MEKSIETLKAEADALGITYQPNIGVVKLKEKIDAHIVPQQNTAEVEKTPEQFQQESDAALAARNNKPQGEAKFTEDQVKLMIQQAIRSVREQDANMDKPEEHSKEFKTARLPRFQNKFIVALKDMNTDEYAPNDVLYTWDVWDDKTRTNIPWATLVFIDGTELAVPYKTAMEKTIKVSCEIAEVKTQDASYKTGEITKLDDNGQSKGETVQGLNKVTKYRWILKIPNTDQTVEVGPEVINW